MRVTQFSTALLGMGILLASTFAPDQCPAIAKLAAAETNTPPLRFGDATQLFADDFLIAHKQNVVRQQGPVSKLGPVLKPDPRLDARISFGFYHSVVYNPHEQKFQAWYNVGAEDAGIAYAESKNGVDWVRPLVSANGTSNVVLPNTGHCVTLDPKLPWGHKEKFKAAWMTSVSRAALAYSSDGVHWSFYNDAEPVTHRAGDTQNQIFWAPDLDAYVLGTRTDLGAWGGPAEHRGWRFMVHDESNDLMNHPTAWRTVVDRIAVDDPDQPAGAAAPDRQFHHISMWYRHGVWFQLMNVWTAPRQKEYDADEDSTRHDRDVSDFYLGASRDITKIDRSFVHARRAFIPRGKGGEWDDDIIIPSPSMITRGDEHWIYYCGMNERIWNFRNRDRSYIGLAKLPLNRMIGQAASDQEGVIVTRPFVWEGKSLEVNVDAVKGEFRVEVLDQSGQPIDGFGGQNARTYRGIDELRLSPRWENSASELTDRTIRLRFRFRNAVLYAFRVAQYGHAC